MSNCLKFPAVDVVLDATKFAQQPPEVSDLDGNTIVWQKGEMLFRPAEMTTRREFRHFVRSQITPYVQPELKDRVAVNIQGVLDEADGFRRAFTLVVVFSEDYEKVI